MNRMTRWTSSPARWLFAWAGMALSGLVLAGATNWESPFPSAPAEQVYGYQQTGLFTGYGQVFAGLAQSPAPVARIDTATGTTSWSVATAGQQSDVRIIVLPLADGGALIVSDVLSRRDGSGAQLWKVGLPSLVMAAALLPSGDVVTAVNGPLSVIYHVFDDADGHLLETLDLSRFGNDSCQASQLAATQSALYALNRCSSGTNTRTLIKLAYSPLRIEWSRPAAISGEFLISFGAQFAADSDSVYISSGNALGRIAPASGALIWQHTGSGAIAQLRRADDGSALIAREGLIEKHNTADGSTAWTRTGLDEIQALATSGDSVVVGGSSGTESNPAGYLARLDLADGELVWRRSAAEPSGGTSNVRHAAIAGDAVIALGSGCKSAPYADRCIARLWRTPLLPVAAVTSSPFESNLHGWGSATEDGDAHTLAAAVEWIGDSVQIRVRRIRNSDGNVGWEATLPVAAFTRWDIPGSANVIRSGDGHIVVAALHQTTGGFDVYGRLVLTKLDAATGSIIWSRSSIDLDVSNILPSLPVSDNAGHVFLGTHENDVIGQSRRSVRKLDGASGLELWRHDLPSCWSCSIYDSPSVEMLGNDVLTSLGTNNQQMIPWTRLDGVTGNVVWSNPALTSQLFRLDADRALAVTSANGQLNLRRVDLSTGDVAASAAYSYPGDTFYVIHAAKQRADGVVFASGERYAFEGPVQVRNSLLLRVAATGTSIDWAQRMTTGPVSVTFPGALLRALGSSSVYVSQGFWGNKDVSQQFLTRIDADSGAFIDSQLLAQLFLKQPSQAQSRYNFQRIAEGMPLITYSQKYQPDQAMIWRVTGRPAPDDTVAGALSVSLVVNQDATGSIRPFTYTTRNDGSTIAENVDASLQIPANAQLIGATCQLDGAACPLQTTATLLRTTLAMPAGSQLVISGTLLRVPGNSEDAPLQAASFAAYGFSELDMKDNRASVRPFDAMFANGFD